MPMTLGAIYYYLKVKYQHGIKTAYYRDIARNKITMTSPVTNTNSDKCEIHILTSTGDMLNAIWCLKSFYGFSSKLYRLCIHDDGTLLRRDTDFLRVHFPNARIISRAESNRLSADKLRNYRRCLNFRNSNPLALKVFDFMFYLEVDRLLLLDSDILFYAAPVELMRRIESPDYHYNTLNKDWADGYSVSPNDVAREFNFTLYPKINSGLGLIHKDSFILDDIERYLSLPGIGSHDHRVEQTLIGLYSSKYGFEYLPKEYDVRLNVGDYAGPCRHFTGPIRHLMYKEGISYLIKQGFISKKGFGSSEIK